MPRSDSDPPTTRAGDVRHSQAEIQLAARPIGYHPVMDFEEGLERTVDWFRRA
jgi:nucleoside-diphosphate-sugar epimerase